MEERFNEAVLSRSVAILEEVWKQYSEIDQPEKKSMFDHFLRSKAISLLADNGSKASLLDIVSFSFEAASKDFCARGTPVALLMDIFDLTPIEKCGEFFDFVEDKIPQWKSEPFFETCKNHLLRMCNDLLRRLSRTTDTGFCGRILVFLARCLPLTEKSGLNLTSQFNVDNVSKFDAVEGVVEPDTPVQKDPAKATFEPMDVEEGEMDDSVTLVPVDYNLYCKFWQLQSFFASPLSCYDKYSWKKFSHNASEVLNAFASHKLEDISGDFQPKKKFKPNVISDAEKEKTGLSETSSYFAKYLTSQKLLQLQLNDNNFRRYVLVQFIILFQYLSAEVKFKDKKLHSLTEEQNKWVDEMNEKCYSLLRETYPEGTKFSETVKHLMNREEHWNQWKNAGCEDFTKRADKEKMLVFKRRTKPKRLENALDLGNPILTSLWNTNPDNFAACKAIERQFVPELEPFIKEPLEQADPENQIEDQYKLIKDENFQWRALRLMSMKCNSFFSPPTAQITSVANFLEGLIKTYGDPNKIGKDDAKTPDKAGQSEDQSLNNDQQQEQEMKTQTSLEEEAEFQAERQAENLVSDEQIALLSASIGAEWPKLTEQLEMSKESVEALKKKQVPADACSVLLSTWSDREGSQATIKRLRNLLLQAELFNEEIAAILHKTDDLEMASVRSETEENGDERTTPVQDEKSSAAVEA